MSTEMAESLTGSSNHDMSLTLDVNSDLYPLSSDTNFAFALASSLHEGGAERDDGGWRMQDIEGGLADDWEYVMYGKVYKFDEDTAERVTAYASFGGLLMALSGNYRHLSNVTVGDYIYLLMRRQA
ncbi:DNA-directed RNA polymerases I, II, and III subunit RPABC3 [Microbotryomycetes sp. JL201]|nr:DNA-directed RNA polymerases I, II, and III subunit RPABC3 [Microbotryomycetes sp. JL201]